MDNIRAVVEASGLTLDNIVKTTIFLTDMGDFATVNEVYKNYFTPLPLSVTDSGLTK